MKKILLPLLFVLFLLPLAVMGQCGSGLSVIDADGNSYATVKVGSYCWMQSNLKTRVPGSSIYRADMYPDTSANLDIYGRLYNWYAAMNIQPGETPVVSEHGFVQGVCPSGWHLPTADEISQLATYSVPGLHDTHYWMVPGTNTTAYTMRPGGYYNANKNRSEDLCGSSYMWTAQSLDESSPSIVWSDCHCDHFVVDESAAGNGLSVRCVRDDMSVSTDSANTITRYAATLHGNLIYLDYASVNAGFKYGTGESALTSIVAKEDAMTATGLFSCDITGLTANTQYYYKAFAANGTDTVYGEVKNFTTAADIVTDTVVFFANGGIGTMDTMFVTRGDTVLNANTYTHGGNWHFDGWNTAADGSGTQYADHASITTNGNLTLYAQWHTWCTGIPKTSVNEFGTSRIDSVKDIDNNKYNVVQIGNQCWLKENLRTLTNSADTGIIYTPTTTGYDVETYGRLYDWYAVMQGASSSALAPSGVQGICPDGWHVPSDAEWDTLTYYVYNSANPDYKCSGCSSSGWEKSTKCIANALSAATGWNNPSECYAGHSSATLNATGFSALPAGTYNPNAQTPHSNFGNWTSFSSATVGTNDNSCCIRGLVRTSSQVGSSQNTQNVLGLSVRCLRDAEVPAAMFVTTDSATTVTKNSAKLYGNVTDMGGKSEVKTGFKYGTSEDALTSIVAKEDAMTATGLFSYGITGLTANTQYYYKAFAANGTDTVYGEVKNFKTLSINPCPNAATVTDVDNNVYNTVQIGNQCWMAENLRTTTHQYGNVWTKSDVDSAIYGRYYDWQAAMQIDVATGQTYSGSDVKHQGICPTGWHVPSDAEWTQLTDYVNSVADYKCEETDKYIAKALASTTGWNISSTTCAVGNNQSDNNATGFSAVPAGDYNGSSYKNFGLDAYFWSATQKNSNIAYYRDLYCLNATVSRGSSYNKNYGFSVRCLRDAEVPAAMFVTTDSANTITKNSAKLYGNVTSLGTYNQVNAGFKYGTSEDALTSIVSDEVAMMAAGQFSYSITGLTANTQYYYKAFAANGTDTVYGEVKNFKTLSINPCPNAATVTDVDNNVYNTVQIGNQCWMAENLRTTKYANGTAIANGGTTTSTETAYRYFPGGDTNNVATYGHLYNWKAVTRGASTTYPKNPSDTLVQGICPTGWHVPSDAEWDTLTRYVYNSADPDYKCSGCSSSSWEQSTKCIAKALSSTTGWNGSSNNCAVGNNPSANNTTGFSAVPAGVYNGSSFYNVGYYAYFWSATPFGSSNAYSRYFYYSNENVTRFTDNRYSGYSVRCVRDDMSVTTDSANTITKNSAKLYGNVTDMGGKSEVKTGFKYGTSEDALTSIVAKENAMTATGLFSCDITGLTANTQYYYKAFAANGTDTVYGEVKNFTTAAAAFSCGTDSVKDIDNNWYHTVQIGNQCWMAENLRTTKYADGTSISLGSTTSTETAYHYYPTGSSSNVSKYGYLYNWKAVMGNSTSSETNPSGVQGICPKGWHVPSDTEWTQLTNYVSSQSEYVCESINTYNAKALASTTGWNSSSNTCVPGNNPSDNNATGFSAVPAGYYSGGYGSFGDDAHFWSATQYYNSYAYSRYVDYNYADVHKYNYEEYYGFSVRCLRDPMTVTTDSANTITKNSATLYGNVTSLGTYNQVNAGFKYGTSEDALTSIVAKDDAMTATGLFSYGITGLTANTQYYYKAFAANGTDTVYGEVKNFTTAAAAFSCGTSKVKDIDDNEYNTVQIGNQCWMAENLRTTTHQYGNVWTKSDVDSAIYGRYYDWQAAMQIDVANDQNYSGSDVKHQGICPTGWHVSSNAEWDTLTHYVFNSTSPDYKCGEYCGSWSAQSVSCIAKALSSTTGWNSSSSDGCNAGNTGDKANATGFSAVPAGYYSNSYGFFGECARFWSATQSNKSKAYYSSLTYNSASVTKNSFNKGNRFSVRCVRN